MANETMKLFPGLGCGLGATLLLCAAAMAGEPAPAAAPGAPKPPGAADPKAADPKKDKDKPAEKVFVFNAGGRRDPFVFALMPDLPATLVVQDKTDPKDNKPGPKGVITAAEIKRMREESETFYRTAEASFMDGNVMVTITNCDKGIDVFKKAADIAQYRDLLEIRERLTDLRRAGERIKSRQDAEAEFERMGVRLTGVVARAKHSQAIVNGKTVSKGDIVSANNDSVDIVVDDIRPDQVIFQFRGYRVTQELGK